MIISGCVRNSRPPTLLEGRTVPHGAPGSAGDARVCASALGRAGEALFVARALDDQVAVAEAD